MRADHTLSPALVGLDTEHWSVRVCEALRSIGLNAVGVVDGREHAELLPRCRSIIIFASGGSALWDAFVEDLRRHPDHLWDSPHPLDDFIKRHIAMADPAPPSSRRWIRCAAEPEAFLDFRPLAVQSSLGWKSRLGLLLHPVFGPWIGLRAACLTSEALPPDAPLPERSPCDGCPAPCKTACPANALSSGSMDVRRCAAFHLESTHCSERCDARLSCPQGVAFRYSALEQHYHSSRGSGRKRLASFLRIDGDNNFRGRDPDWAKWSSPPRSPS